MRPFRNTLLSAALLPLLAAAAAAGPHMLWNEVDVVLDRDGKAQVSYTSRWDTSGGTLHGFYFEGFQETPVFDLNNAYALDGAGNRYPLAINRLSGTKYDIILADGKAFTGGEVTYFFRYAADLEASGNVTQTMAGDKQLTVFNWAPVQWDDPLRHQALTVHFPAEIDAPITGDKVPEALNWRTEKFVNEQYKIDYPVVKDAAGKDVFSVRFYREDLGSRYHFQVQVYMAADKFALKTMAYGDLLHGAPDRVKYLPAKEEHYLNRYFPGGMLSELPITRGETLFLVLALLAVFGALPLLIMTVKHNSMLTAQEGISAVNWDNTQWAAPKAEASSFRTPCRWPSCWA
jgi:hypothetical protein